MKLNIYMKSGNVITTHGVKAWEVKERADAIVSLTIKYSWFANHVYCREQLIITSIALGQIEAITVS